MSYAEFDAAIAAGASLDELFKWTTGGYPRSFKVKVLAWHNLHNAIEMHKSDAMERSAQRHRQTR